MWKLKKKKTPEFSISILKGQVVFCKYSKPAYIIFKNISKSSAPLRSASLGGWPLHPVHKVQGNKEGEAETGHHKNLNGQHSMLSLH